MAAAECHVRRAGGESAGLGAWKDAPDCYYFRTDATEDYGRQYFRVVKPGAAPGAPILSGPSADPGTGMRSVAPYPRNRRRRSSADRSGAWRRCGSPKSR